MAVSSEARATSGPANDGTDLPFAVVTGASEGIGLAIADRLARQGRPVLLVARSASALAAAAESIRSGTCTDLVRVLALDVTALAAPVQIEAAVAAAGGHVDLLVNNAGMGLAGPFDDRTTTEIDQLLSLNVVALTRLMRHFLPGMKARRQGGILNIASLGGYIPGPYQAAYYASKAYVISLSEAVDSEARAYGVTISVVSPGPVSTRFHDKMGATGSLYRALIPGISPTSVARWALIAHRLGFRSTAPGLINTIFMSCLRILPHRLVIPIIAWLLKPRKWETRNARG